MGDAATGMVEGLGSLVSYNPETHQWGDWGHAGKAALGVVEGLGALIAPTPLFQVFADDSSGVTPGWMRDFSRSTLEKQQLVLDGFVGSEELWSRIRRGPMRRERPVHQGLSRAAPRPPAPSATTRTAP